MNATKLCSIEDCESPSRKRGWCEKHYKRWKRHGDTAKINRFDTPEESFLARIESHGDCLIWAGSKNHKGYGQISVNGTTIAAHRYAWTRVNGPIPEGMKIDHKDHCDPACCNVKHLRVATHSQNSWNRSGPELRNTESGLRNVYKHGTGWMVRVVKDGKRHYFGIHEEIEEANKVAAKARQQLFGEYAGRG